MVGDGVNDVPALKASRLSIAQGSGTQMAKAVSDVVLVNGDFAADPGDGRRGPADPPQHPAGDEAVRDQVGVRRVPDRRDRDHARRLPAAAAPPDARRRRSRSASRRSSSRWRRARARGAPTASCATWAGSPSLPGVAAGPRRHDELPHRASTSSTSACSSRGRRRPRRSSSIGLYLVLALEATSTLRARLVGPALRGAAGRLRRRPRSCPARAGSSSSRSRTRRSLLLVVVGAGIAIGFLWLTDDRFVPLRNRPG